MGTELAMFSEAQRPAHLDSAFTDSNIEARASVPSLSLTGKVWSIVMNGEKTKLTTKTTDGDKVPVTIMKVIILDYAKRRGRAYYEGRYDPDKEQAPVCWSDDGIKPFDNVQKKQHDKCEGCPQSIKGSKVDGDKQLTACSQHRMLAAIPAFSIGSFPALRLKIAVTSDFDKQSQSSVTHATENWYPFQQYMDFLNSKGVKHSAELVTKIKFDPDAAYPKLYFSPDRWLSPEEVQAVLPMTKDEKTTQLLGDRWTPAGVDGTATDEPAPNTESEVAVSPAPVAETKPDPAPIVDTGEIILEGVDAPAPEPKQEAAQAAVEPEIIVEAPEPQKAAQKAEEAVPPASTKVDPSVAALLADWT